MTLVALLSFAFNLFVEEIGLFIEQKVNLQVVPTIRLLLLLWKIRSGVSQRLSLCFNFFKRLLWWHSLSSENEDSRIFSSCVMIPKRKPIRL